MRIGINEISVNIVAALVLLGLLFSPLVWAGSDQDDLDNTHENTNDCLNITDTTQPDDNCEPKSSDCCGPQGGPGGGGGCGSGSGSSGEISEVGGPGCSQPPKGPGSGGPPMAYAGNPINVGHMCKVDYCTDVHIPLSGGLEFRVERVYSSGRLLTTQFVDTCPMIGKSWHCNLDARVVRNDDEEQNLVVLLPDSRPRIMEKTDTNLWRSKAHHGFLGELTWDSNGEEYTLLLPTKEKYIFNRRGRLIAYRNPQGNQLTFERELYTDQSVTYDRLKAVKAPAYDGRYLEFSYVNSPHQYMVDTITLKTTADENFSQQLVQYEYHTQASQLDLLAEVHYLGTEKGLFYEYGSWDNSTETVVQLSGHPWMRSLAVKGTIDSNGTKRMTRGYAYRLGGIETQEFGWPGIQIWKEYKAVYDEQTPDVPSEFALTYTYCAPDGNVLPGHDTGSYESRVYRGAYDPTVPFTQFTVNFQRMLAETSNSSGYATFDWTSNWDYDRCRIYEVDGGDGRNYPDTYSPGNHLAYNNINSSTDHLGRVTEYVYDTTWNKVSETTDPYGEVTYTTYHQTLGLPTEVEYPNGRIIEAAYNSYGNVIEVTDSFTGETVSYSYYVDDERTSHSPSGGGLLAQVSSPKRETVSVEYDHMGHVTEKNVGSKTITNTFTNNQLAVVSDGVNSVTYEYDDLGRKQSMTDARGNSTTYTYDGLARLVKVTDADSEVTRYSYDLYDHLVAITDAENNRTEYAYDAAGKIIAETDALDNATTYEYADTAACGSCGGGGKLKKKVDAKGQTTVFNYTHDQDGWLRSIDVEYYAAGDDPDVDNPERTVTYNYGLYHNNVEADVLTSIVDDALPFTGQTYSFEYDGDLRLKKITHPEGYYEEYFYNATDGKLLARRDIDGGVTEYAYDTPNYPQRLETIADPWGNTVNYSFYGSSDPDGPFNALESIAYSNNTLVEYIYDSLGRLDTLTNYASDDSVMSSFDYTYDGNGNVTRIDLEDDDAWVYDYDDLNRLTMEKRVDASGQSDVERWHREYAFDAVGNRTYLYWYDGSQTLTTTYNYNNLNQLTSRSGEGGSHVYYYDDNGNMTNHNQSLQGSLTWTIDNRLASTYYEWSDKQTQYKYDYQGARILRIDTDTSRTRYFFNGITEEVVKESVAGAHTDNAFAFVEKEDGESASEWDIYGGPAGASISTAYESGRRSNIIAMSGQSGNMFIIGDMDGSNLNANDTPWNATERVLSFWYIGDWAQMGVAVSTSAGSRLVYYHSSSGTDYMDGSGNVHIYLGASAESGYWNRFERNIEADYEGLAGGSSWTNTDGLGIILGTGDMDTGIDDIKLSNSTTKTFNALTGGSVSQVAAKYDFSNGAPVKDILWHNYTRLGNVRGFSNESGYSAWSTYQDIYGNVLSSITTGAWASSFEGRHLTTKEYDPDGELYYFWQRWVMSNSGRFLSRSSYRPDEEHPYEFGDHAPINWVDPQGMMAVRPPQAPPITRNRAFWGWWCGGGWSGGLKEGEEGPGRPPCGPMDSSCMEHDRCYADPARTKSQCDQALCNSISQLTFDQLAAEAGTCCEVNRNYGNNGNAFEYFEFIDNQFCGGTLEPPMPIW